MDTHRQRRRRTDRQTDRLADDAAIYFVFIFHLSDSTRTHTHDGLCFNPLKPTVAIWNMATVGFKGLKVSYSMEKCKHTFRKFVYFMCVL